MGTLAGKKAQASFEYMAVLAIGLIILVPFVYLFQQYSSQSVNNIQTTVLRTIGDDIINSAETAYYMGYPSRLTLQENFPSGVQDMSLTADWGAHSNQLTFRMYDGKVLSFFTKVNLRSDITPSYYSGGLKNIVLETRNSTEGIYVMIIFT
jgi:hypothetical protein